MSVLYIVATPIGNLADITFRAVDTLKSVDMIACEDTRRTEILLRHYGIHRPLLRYDEHTHGTASRQIQEHLRRGKSVALVTDAGTPAISDPGTRLVSDVLALGFRVVPIPGPSAPVAALSASGLPTDGFVFLGFLPRRKGRAQSVLRDSVVLGRTLIVFESPFRAVDTLGLIAETLPGSRVVAARELTKIHEEFVRGDAGQLRDELKLRPQKGEILLLIGPAAGGTGGNDRVADDET